MVNTASSHFAPQEVTITFTTADYDFGLVKEHLLRALDDMLTTIEFQHKRVLDIDGKRFTDRNLHGVFKLSLDFA